MQVMVFCWNESIGSVRQGSIHSAQSLCQTCQSCQNSACRPPAGEIWPM